jgi:purine-binding chemotaxis protein CheW
MAQQATGTKVADGKFLTFKVKEEEYGIDILKVRDIVGLMDITAVPRTPRHIRGVVNLRGKIIPVMDVRRKFGLEDMELRRENCIITVMVKGLESQAEVLLGLLVDSVSEVVQINSADVEAVPDLGDMRVDFVPGLVKMKNRVIILLDIEKVLQAEDLTVLQGLAKTEAQ